MPSIHYSIARGLLLSVLLVFGMVQVNAAGPTGQDLASAQAQFQKDMALCASGQSNQSLTTCQKEARNALQEARRGGLSAVGSAAEHNAMQRCAVHQGLDRSACEARMRGEDTRTEGSVGGGGILRETTIVVPGS